MGKIVGLDTNIFLFLLEENKHFIDQAEQILSAVRDGKLRGIFSSIGLIELLTGPKKRRRNDLAVRYREVINNFPHLSVGGINENIVELASNLRAHHSLRTPDAIHIATAIDFGAQSFITSDRRLKRVKEINIVLI